MRKKLAGLVLALTVMVTMAACGNSGAQTSEPAAATPTPEAASVQESVAETPTPEVTEAVTAGDIYLIIPTEIGLSAQEEATIVNGAKKEGYKVTVVTSQGDTTKQTEAFDAAIEARASLIICDNVDNDATTASIQKAREVGIPTILINRGIESQGNAVSQILTDRRACASRLAEIFAEQMGRSGTYAYIQTSANAQMTADVDAFAEAMNAYESMTSVDRVDADEYNREAVKETIRHLLTEKPEVQALVCANGVQAHAAVDIVSEQGTELTIICLDGNDDEISTLILSGKMYAAVVKPAEDLAGTAIGNAVAYIKNGTTGTSESMYYAGAILTQKETILIVSPTPTQAPEGTPTPIPSNAPETDDSEWVEVEIDDSDIPVGDDLESGTTDATEATESTESTETTESGEVSEDTSNYQDNVVIFDYSYEEGELNPDGMEGRPDMQ